MILKWHKKVLVLVLKYIEMYLYFTKYLYQKAVLVLVLFVFPGTCTWTKYTRSVLVTTLVEKPLNLGKMIEIYLDYSM